MGLERWGKCVSCENTRRGRMKWASQRSRAIYWAGRHPMMVRSRSSCLANACRLAWTVFTRYSHQLFARRIFSALAGIVRI